VKKILLFIFIIISSAPHLRAQGFILDSTRFISGNNPATAIGYVIPTSDKGLLFTGATYGNPGGIIPSFPLDTVLSNVLIGKIDSNRQISWLKVYGGSEADAAASAVQTPDGGYAVLASTESDNGNVTGFKGEDDIWLLRIDASGNLLWEKTYGSTLQDDAMSIACTADHGFIISGFTYGSDDDVPFHYGNSSTADWLVVKTDSMGNVQWSRDLGGTGDEGQNGSVLAADDGYYLLSYSNSTDYNCTDSFWHPGVNTGNDYYVLKLDTAGNVLWDSSYGGSSNDEISNAIYDARDSTMVMIGSTASDDYMVTGAFGCDPGDMWVVKINMNGTRVWKKILGSIQYEAGDGICEAPGGGYMAYGVTGPEAPCYDSSIGDIGDQDCWLFSIDSAANIISSKVFGGTNIEMPYAIAPVSNGYAAVGISISTVFSEGTTSGRNCSGECAFISYLDYGTLAVKNLQLQSVTITVYPVPAQSNINIVLPAIGKLTIINNIGQQLYTGQAKTGSQNVWVQDWPDGIYLVVWQGEDGTVLTQKIVKN